jgi:hypothetical protein
MADKTPVRVVFNASNVATGMAEFQTGESVPVANGGTGLTAVGSAGQVLKVNAAGSGLEFGAEGDISITNLVAPTNSDLTLTTSGTGNIVLDAITFRGTTISSADSSIININEGVVVDGTLNTSGQATLSGLAYPTSDGTIGQFLKTDGSGTLSFADLSLGDLSIVGSTITTPSNADFILDPSGTGKVNINGAYTLPSADGNADQFLKTDGSGVVSFADLSLGDLTIIGSTISVPSDADFTLDPSGTGAIKLNANTDITGNLTVTGTLDLGDSNFTNVGSIALDTITNDGTDITLDSSGDIVLDAGGADVFLKDDGTTYGSLTNTSGNLIIKSGTTAALTFSGANVTAEGNLTVDGNLDVTGTMDLSDSNFTNVGSLQLDSIAGDGDTNTSITFSGSDVITIATGGSGRLTIGDGALSPVTDDQIDLGTSSLEFKDAYFDGTVTSDAFAGPLTGDVTGNVTGTAATVTGAAQTNITSVGTLTTLTVDNVIINGTTIGHTSDTDAIAIGSDGDVTLTQDLELQHDGAILSFGADDEIAITHVHDTGLLLTDSGGTPTLQLHDSNESVSSDGTNLILTSGGTSFKMPTADGNSGDVLKTDGSGTMSFASSAATPSDDTRVTVKSNKSVSTSARTIDYFQATGADMAWYFMALNDLTNDHTGAAVFAVCHNDSDAFAGGPRGGSSGTANTMPATTADISSGQVRVKVTAPSADSKISYYKIPISRANTADATAGVTVTTSNTDVDSGSEVIDSFAHASFRAAKYTILIDNNSKTETGVIEALVVHDGSEAFISPYGIVNTGNNDMITLTAQIVSANVVVSAAGLEPNLSLKIHKTLLSDSMSAVSNGNQKIIGATTVSSSATSFDNFDLDDATAAMYYVVGGNSSEGEFSVYEVFCAGAPGEASVTPGSFVSTKGTTQLEFTAGFKSDADNSLELSVSSTSGGSTVVNAYRINCLAE